MGTDPTSAEATYGHISSWDVSGVTDMKVLFHTWRNPSCSTFNDDISGWDVSSVTNMLGMFLDASSFNQCLDSWVLSSSCNDCASSIQDHLCNENDDEGG